ncbi:MULTISPECIES: GAF and ANTAR domain-containing protein [unclassified Mycobacterium]|uniref:GAF and ANTAR domain-containing protein n=1 Tax=unclassified Mycobacterium TaxID=2642494 RepID=UPI0007FE31AE|nr:MULTISPECIES: GAF and ANTAR domain-containing protein [unclassified Mycobacterium]OBG72549.1 response regulator receiver protein [Mycobacterium sp. E1214]OBH31779.1 response regulator receiver protein [Mycobacterium sp. E1319]
MHETDSNADVYHRIADVARDLHGTSPGVADSVVEHIAEYAVAEVPGAQYAGVTLVTATAGVQTAAATHRYPAMLDAIQQLHHEGPCLTAQQRHRTVRVDDLAAEERWPSYRRDALSYTPIRSVLAFPLFTSDRTRAALNVYADAPHAFAEDAADIGYVLATHAALAWDAARRRGQFLSALASRDVIGQAKGILMTRFGVDAVQAFELLKRLSQDRNVKLIDVARGVAELPRSQHL